MINLNTIGQRITELRKKNRMTQNDLAKSLFVTHQAISKWENGKSMPNLEILYELTQLFHTTIDYLLDDAISEESTYEEMFQHSKRETVINHFLNQTDLDQAIQDIFYLLTSKERTMIINQMIHGVINLTVDAVWPHLSNSERQYILRTIITGKLDYNIHGILHKLTNEEQLMVQHAIRVGTYPYKIRYKSKEDL